MNDASREAEQAAMNPVKVKQPQNTITIPVDEYEWVNNLLEAAMCPNCNGSGVIQTDDEIFECRWCRERKEAIDKARSEP